MDVNGTRFHLLLNREDWFGPSGRPARVSESGTPLEPDLRWDESSSSVGLRKLLFQFTASAGDEPQSIDARRGAARDRYGNWYWIDEDRTSIRYLPACRTVAEHFWASKDLARPCEADDPGDVFKPVMPPAPPVDLVLSGLAVTEHHYLVVGVIEPAGLLIFDLHAGGDPIRMTWPAKVPFSPLDMAPAPGGGVWILDRDSRYWALDRYFRVIPAEQAAVEIEPGGEGDFQPVDGEPVTSPGRTFPAGITLDMASPISAMHPVSIEALPDGTVLIADYDPPTVYRYRYSLRIGMARLDQALDEVLEPDEDNPTPYALKAHDIAFVADDGWTRGHLTGTLYVVGQDGNQAFAFTFTEGEDGFGLEPVPAFYPMRLFTGRALVASGGTVYYDQQELWPKLVEQPRRRYVTEGVIETAVPFDGREPDCVWHRLLFDGCIPPGCEVRIETRAANSSELLQRAPWQLEPKPYRRSDASEMPWYQPYELEAIGRDGVGTWELLFQRAVGRYLQLRLTLRGTGRSSPRVRALRAWYPRFSYLKQYLPAVYQDDETSASFLDRFLANLEGLYTTIEGRIAAAQVLFDVRTVGKEYLDWLAGWFGVMLEPGWEEFRSRLFLRHAMELFRQRGTPAGLVRTIRLAIDPCPDDSLFEDDVMGCREGNITPCDDTHIDRYSVRLVERFLTRQVPGVAYGDPTDTVAPGLILESSGWTPDQGVDPLHRRYRDYLKGRYGTVGALSDAWGEPYVSFDALKLPPVTPANEKAAADWRLFLRDGLGFNYAVIDAADEPAYRAFLARRYQRAPLLNAAYGLTGESALTSFSQVKLPAEDAFPSGGRPLYDWIRFVSLAVPIRRAAHRFTVLVPTHPGDDTEAQNRRLELVRRIVELNRPAHTSFEVKQYWAMFRVGEARLGLDTLLDEGSRFVALLLGSGYLAESYLAPPHPWDVKDRIVTGRDPIGPQWTL